MKLQIIFVSILLIVGNLCLRISPETALSMRVAYILALFVLVAPILIQLIHRGIKKTFFVIGAILSAVLALLGTVLILFKVVSPVWTPHTSSSLFFALTLQNISIAYHCLQYRKHFNRREYNHSGYALGLFFLLVATICLGAITAFFEYSRVAGYIADPYWVSAAGFFSHAVGVAGVWSISAAMPTSQ